MYTKEIITKQLNKIYDATEVKDIKSAIIYAKHSQIEEIKTIGFEIALAYKKSFDGKLPFNITTIYGNITG